MLNKEEHDFYEVTGELIYFEKGFKCRVVKDVDLGHLCGYVEIPKDHPFYGLNRDSVPIAVHGGITYASHQFDEYVIGFDCGHSGDYIPNIMDEKELAKIFPEFEMISEILCKFKRDPNTYKDLNFVKGEITRMVRQLEFVEHTPITYKKANKMILKGRSLFFKNPRDAGYILTVDGHKSLTHFIVKEHNNFLYDPQSPAEVMASKWYLMKEEI